MSTVTWLKNGGSEIIWAVITAAVLGTGSMVIGAQTDNTRQDAVLEQHSEALELIEKLNDKLDETNINLIRLNERINYIEKAQQQSDRRAVRQSAPNDGGVAAPSDTRLSQRQVSR